MDYANTRGYTIMLERQFYKNFGLNIDYSWMLAEGTYSNPTDAYFDALNDQAPRLGMIPLNWDQTHTLNMRITTGLDNWMASIIGNFWSGKPYTPEFKIGSNAGSSTFSGFEDNSGKKPSVLSFDLRLMEEHKIKPSPRNVPRDFDLDVFGIRKDIASKKDLIKILQFPNSYRLRKYISIILDKLNLFIFFEKKRIFDNRVFNNNFHNIY